MEMNEMNRQSDFGYSLPQIENRTVALCVQRARSCLAAARRDPDARPYYCSDATHRQAARQWVEEGKIRREWDRRQSSKAA